MSFHLAIGITPLYLLILTKPGETDFKLGVLLVFCASLCLSVKQMPLIYQSNWIFNPLAQSDILNIASIFQSFWHFQT
jgi:hypothetical protein